MSLCRSQTAVPSAAAPSPPPSGQRFGRDIALFGALTILFTALSYVPLLAVDQTVSARRSYILLLMWSPGIAALLACWLCRTDLTALGWRWPSGRWMGIGYGLPVAYTAVAYGLIWLTGLATFAPPDALAGLASAYGWPGAHPALLISGTTAIKATAGFVIAASSALGEEIGWRGFLAPRVASCIGAARGSLVIGLIWLVWHVPLLLGGGYNNDTEWWFGLTFFTVLVLSGSVVAMWLRLRSGSIWPCVAWHANHNLFVQSIFGGLAGEVGPITRYVVGEFGVAVPLVLLVLSVPIYRDLTSADWSRTAPARARALAKGRDTHGASRT